MFNQTVAVKDIRSLNDFIRQHMLEAVSWRERIDGLLSHFAQLSEAHRSLVRVREQRDLLDPVANPENCTAQEREQLENLSECWTLPTRTFGSKRSRCSARGATSWLNGAGQRWRSYQPAQQSTGSSRSISSERLQNEIDQAGGQRLREITNF